MDLEENIRIAAEVYQHQKCYVDKGIAEECIDCFITGAKSQSAKDYWYNEFTKDLIPELSDEQKLDIEYGTTELGHQYHQYLKDNPDRPISFNNWKYMVEHYPTEPWIDCNELNASIDRVQGKRIGIIGHVDHGKTFTVGLGLRESQKGVIIMDMDTPLTPEERFEVMENLKFDLSAIKSIVPIADVIPEEIISKQEFLKMHDKAVECSITEETYKESRAWDIKKEKKVSHKRNNKRKK